MTLYQKEHLLRIISPFLLYFYSEHNLQKAVMQQVEKQIIQSFCCCKVTSKDFIAMCM